MLILGAQQNCMLSLKWRTSHHFLSSHVSVSRWAGHASETTIYRWTKEYLADLFFVLCWISTGFSEKETDVIFLEGGRTVLGIFIGASFSTWKNQQHPVRIENKNICFITFGNSCALDRCYRNIINAHEITFTANCVKSRRPLFSQKTQWLKQRIIIPIV